jgi:hypothetical protein
VNSDISFYSMVQRYGIPTVKSVRDSVHLDDGPLLLDEKYRLRLYLLLWLLGIWDIQDDNS